MMGECPFCSDMISLVLNVQMIVGTSEQMEKFDMMKSGENLHLIESEYDIHAKTYKQIYERRYPGASEDVPSENHAYSNNNQTSNQEVETTSKHSHNISQLNFRIQDNCLAPVMLRHKLQQLKDPRKYAQVIFVAGFETQQNFKDSKLNKERQQSFPTNFMHMETTLTPTLDDHTSLKENKENPRLTLAVPTSSEFSAFALTQAVAARMQKYSPPEMFHTVDEKQTKQFNAELMRAIIQQKMDKNKCFAELMLPSED